MCWLYSTQVGITLSSFGYLSVPQFWGSDSRPIELYATVNETRASNGSSLSLNIGNFSVAWNEKTALQASGTLGLYDTGFHRPTLTITSLQVLFYGESVASGNALVSVPVGRPGSLPHAPFTDDESSKISKKLKHDVVMFADVDIAGAEVSTRGCLFVI